MSEDKKKKEPIDIADVLEEYTGSSIQNKDGFDEGIKYVGESMVDVEFSFNTIETLLDKEDITGENKEKVKRRLGIAVMVHVLASITNGDKDKGTEYLCGTCRLVDEMDDFSSLALIS